jgi:hypothetical protein
MSNMPSLARMRRLLTSESDERKPRRLHLRAFNTVKYEKARAVAVYISKSSGDGNGSPEKI